MVSTQRNNMRGTFGKIKKNQNLKASGVFRTLLNIKDETKRSIVDVWQSSEYTLQEDLIISYTVYTVKYQSIFVFIPNMEKIEVKDLVAWMNSNTPWRQDVKWTLYIYIYIHTQYVYILICTYTYNIIYNIYIYIIYI